MRPRGGAGARRQALEQKARAKRAWQEMFDREKARRQHEEDKKNKKKGKESRRKKKD